MKSCVTACMHPVDKHDGTKESSFSKLFEQLSAAASAVETLFEKLVNLRSHILRSGKLQLG